MTANFDVIGDIHGSADKLFGLLDALGWELREDGECRHQDADRKVIFVGDLIDRGSDQLKVLQTVRSMVERGTAQIVMGNHEFNAICFATPHPHKPGEFLRPHSDKNCRQHKEFLNQIGESERSEWIAWFRTLPLWLDLGELRVVHACWHGKSIENLEASFGGATIPADDEVLLAAAKKGNPVGDAIEVILKGPEIELEPYGLSPYLDKDGHVRGAARVRWWSARAQLISDLIDIPSNILTVSGEPYPPIPDLACRAEDQSFSYSDDVPVIYGHHWRTWEPSEHHDYTQRTACVDFSAVRGGPLVAYRWRGESTIDERNYLDFAGDFS